MKSKNKLFLFLLLLAFSSFGQENNSVIEEENNEVKIHTIGTISLPEMNILYRNYKNKIEYACNHSPDSVIIKINGATLEMIDNHSAIVYPGSNRECSITLCIISKQDTTCIGTYKYRVSNLPPPSFYFGTIPLNTEIINVSDIAFFSMNKFFAKYPPEIPLTANFCVKKWTAKIGNRLYEGNSPMLTDEFKKAIYFARKNTVITFLSYTYQGMGIEETINLNTKFYKKSKRKTPFEKPQLDSKCTG